MPKSSPKIAVVHDYFLFDGGGERLVITMANGLKADLITSYVLPESTFIKQYKGGKLITITAPTNLKGWKHFKINWAFKHKAKFLKNYDIVIFSGNGVYAVGNCRPDALKILYCHTPPRFVYDKRQQYAKRYKSPLRRKLFYLLTDMVAWQYGKSFNMVDCVIANSNFVKKRIAKYLGYKNATVVYPPCNMDKFSWKRGGDFYFSFSRLDHLKRVDLAAAAFQKLPDKKLVVASGGPTYDKICEMAEGYKNIEVVGRVSDQKLFDLVGSCLATIYVPQDEDFGMTAVESMSAGKPVIGVNEGGLKEIVLHKKTGYLCPKEITVDSIVDGVKYMTKPRAAKMRLACRNRAKQFSEQEFLKGIDTVIKEGLKKKNA